MLWCMLMALGGPHAEQEAQYRDVQVQAPLFRAPLPLPTNGPDMVVYGYLAYWNDDLYSVQWDEISHIALFSAEVNTDGSLSSTDRWDQAADAVALAAPYGVRVHLCITNFNPSELETLLGSSSARATLISNLASWKASTGAHGINVDFESLPSSRRSQMVDFVADLEAAVGEVVLATPSVDWSDAWDEAALSNYADLFIMGYGYHWGGSSYAGPSDPLYAGSGTVWNGIQSYSLTRTVDQYISDGADPSRIILGLPLYGMEWNVTSNSVPASTSGSGSSITFEAAWATGLSQIYEPDSHSMHSYDGSSQIWFGDADTVGERIAWVRDSSSIAGIGFWALHYGGDDPTLWSTISDETSFLTTPTTTTPTVTGTTTTPPPNTTTTTTSPTNPTTTTEPPGTNPTQTGTTPTNAAFVANAGRPFFAYVGDSVRLNADQSSGPSSPLQYRWTQIEGPPVTLDAAQTSRPTFVVQQWGNLAFELRVGDGNQWSAPARSDVIIVDANGGSQLRQQGCGCEQSPINYSWMICLLLAALPHRRST